jgi:hypothetical protein
VVFCSKFGVATAGSQFLSSQADARRRRHQGPRLRRNTMRKKIHDPIKIVIAAPASAAFR